MATSATVSPMFAQLAHFSMHDPASTTPTSSPRFAMNESVMASQSQVNTGGVWQSYGEQDQQEPAGADGVRSLSISSDTTVSSVDETPTPPMSPIRESEGPAIRRTSAFGTQYDENVPDGLDAAFVKRDPYRKSFDDDLTPIQETIKEVDDRAATPSAAPTSKKHRRGQSTPFDGLSSLAARRASAGRLPSDALVHLHQMRIESISSGVGLGVEPGSAALDTCEQATSAPPSISSTLERSDSENVMAASRRTEHHFDGRSGLAVQFSSSSESPPMWSAVSTSSPRPAQVDRLVSPKIPRTPPMRSSTLGNLSNRTLSPTHAHISLSPTSPTARALSLGLRYAPSEPRTPLTPSHVPDAPFLPSEGFDWTTYTIHTPASPLPRSPRAPSPALSCSNLGPEPSPRSNAAPASPRASPLRRCYSNPYFPPYQAT